MVKKMHGYRSLKIFSVYLFAGPENDKFIADDEHKGALGDLGMLRFVPVKPIKEKAGLFKRVKVNPMEVIGKPLFFDIEKVTKKCCDLYYSDGWLCRLLHRRKQHSPIICAPSKLRFPFSHPLIPKTSPAKSIAGRVSEDNMFDDSAGSGSGDIVDEDFFDSGGAS